MKEIVIRKENYGFLVFNPLVPGYYRIYDKKIQELIEKGINEKKFSKLLEMFPEEYKTLGIEKLPFRFVDNTKLGDNVFVPLEVYFDYTSKCNRNCDYCYNKKYLGNKTMPQEDVRKMFDNFYELGIMRVHLAGGEPTIDYNGIKNYIEYGRSKGMIISLATNGNFLNDKICELLTTNDLLSVSISLDSAIPTENDTLRGKGTYEIVMEGLKRLKDYKIKNKSNIELCFKPVYNANVDREKIIHLIKLAIDCDMDKIKFANPERCEDHERGYYGERKTNYYKTLKMIKQIIEENKSEITITNVTNPYLFDFVIGIEENKGCIGAQELITINPDGRITPCLMNHTLLGNVYDYESLKDFLINSKELKKYISLIGSYNCNCNIHDSCRGGCQVRKKVEYGEITAIDPLCPSEMITKNKNNSLKKIRKIDVYHSL